MFNHLAPAYLSSLIPQQVNDISRHYLRNSNNIQTIRAKTNQYNNSFLPSTIRDWNNLPVEAKQANTVSSFKYFLKKEKSKCQNTTITKTESLRYSTPDYEQAAVL